MEEESSSRSKSISSNPNSRRQSSATTSLWEISQKSSNSSHSSSLSDLKRRNELLKIQLKQRESELTKEKLEKEERLGERIQAQSENDQMKAKISALTVICDDLHQIITNCEEEQEKRLRELEDMYRNHFEEISSISKRLRSENGDLKKRLIDCQTKKSSNDQENRYLHWENESTRLEMEKLKGLVEQKDKETSELKMEIMTLKLNQQKLTQTSNAKLERVIQTTSQSTTSQLNQIKMQFEDREKEYGLTLTKIRNEMEFLQKELERRENQVNRLTTRLDELTIDNKKLLDINSELRHDTDDELAILKSEISKYRHDLDVLKDQNENLRLTKGSERGDIKSMNYLKRQDLVGGSREKLEMLVHEKRIEEAQALIRTLRAQVYDLRKSSSPQLSDHQILSELQRSRLELAELREKLRDSRRDCEEERQQRMDITKILIEMSKDMQTLIQINEKLEANT